MRIEGVLTELHPVLNEFGATIVVDGQEVHKITGKDLRNRRRAARCVVWYAFNGGGILFQTAEKCA